MPASGPSAGSIEPAWPPPGNHPAASRRCQTGAMSERRAAAGRRGRNDPGRRDRLVDATVAVIAARGVAGLTHRAVADAAGVPLGSTTYHLGSRDELLGAALRAAANDYNRRLRDRFAALPPDADLAEALVELMLDWLGPQRDRTVVEYELYLAAVRRPALRAAATAWVEQITAMLAEHVDPVTARAVTATVDGLLIEWLVAERAPDRDDLLPVLRRILHS